MRERWKEWQRLLEEMKMMSNREYVLALAVCALSGLVIGMLISPRKRVQIGCNNGNGNNNVGSLVDGDECGCEDECEDDCCCEE